MKAAPEGEGRRGRRGRRKTALVIFGSSGNLATFRLVPAVNRLAEAGSLPKGFWTVGVDRRKPRWRGEPGRLSFVRGDITRGETYERVAEELRRVSGGGGLDLLFYLATGPEHFLGVVDHLKAAGLSRGGRAWPRIAVEKPFGVDLRSARRLESHLDATFAESRIYRVDHFLAKSEALEVRRVRFGRRGADSVWNSRFVDHVQVMADEGGGLGGRGRFYDSVGAFRDMVQSHLLHLLCLVAMERPGPGDKPGLAKAMGGVLRCLRPPRGAEVAWGQYLGYREERGVKDGSSTPTFVAMKLLVGNSRWEGVPFYLRTGKMMARGRTEVVVVFKNPTLLPGVCEKGEGPSALTFCFGPVPRTVLGFRSRGASQVLPTERADAGPGGGPVEDEYQRLLVEAMAGDKTHFVDREFNLLSWRLFGPILEESEGSADPPAGYRPGTWGPRGSDGLLAGEGRAWLDGRDSAHSLGSAD